jgi:glycine/D-amino acid oxidase-like deaminating enzyme/nitrite reductase/ring-hydroxylating ferredoxin subunit
MTWLRRVQFERARTSKPSMRFAREKTDNRESGLGTRFAINRMSIGRSFSKREELDCHRAGGRIMPTKSYWTETSPEELRFKALDRSTSVDVAVIGGGITGVTTAYLLKKAGKSVALFERDSRGEVNTGHTTAHVTHVTDLRLSEAVSRFGRDHAEAAWDAGVAAIQQLEDIVRDEGIDCDFARVPGFLCASIETDQDQRQQLQADAELAAEMGFSATYLDMTPLLNRPGIRFANQARFHPLKYLNQLIQRIPGSGGYVYEQTEVTEFNREQLGFTANGHAVECQKVIVATDIPLMGKTGFLGATLLQTKLAPYTSYAIGAAVPRDRIPDALFWDLTDPYYYLRLQRQGDVDYAIWGGRDHKTGQEDDPQQRFRELESTLRQIAPEARCEFRWSGQVTEPVDGLPYIGEVVEQQFVATGYAGNGMTFGTLAAVMARDWVLGAKNPWRDLFAVHRKNLKSSWNYLRENIDYPYYMLKGRLSSVRDSLDDVRRGEGRVVVVDGQRIAAYRDLQGELTQRSSICPHLGCVVKWNPAEKTWDCPCHGSRFRATGEVLAGPAEKPLEPILSSV